MGYGWWLSTAVQKFSVVPITSSCTEWLGLRQAKYPTTDSRTFAQLGGLDPPSIAEDGFPAKVVGEDEEVGQAYYAVAIEVEAGIEAVLVSGFAEMLGEEEEVVELHLQVVVEKAVDGLAMNVEEGGGGS